MNYKIVTISNRIPHEWYYMCKEFDASLKGHPVEKIFYPDSQWVGLTTKVRWLKRAIEEGRLDSEYLIYTDSWDMVFAKHPDEVIAGYEVFHSDIVISTEKTCFPDTYKKEFDEQSTAKYRYLNSGFIVGKTDAIYKCLVEMNLDTVPGDYYDTEKNIVVNPEDQTLWMQIYLKQPVSIELDTHQELSQTLHEHTVNDFDFTGMNIKNKETASFPCAFHFNGSGKSNIELRTPILKHLNLL